MFSVTCNGNCLNKEETEMNEKSEKCNGTGNIVIQVEYECGTCEGSGKISNGTCIACNGTGKRKIPEERPCPGCVNCRKMTAV
jgi:DnaJ-class molecular chaperone